MIVGVTIRNFKGIRDLDRLRLDRFHVVVGPNGSGKTTFLDAINFVRDCQIGGVPHALDVRGVGDLHQLTWMQRNSSVHFGIWLDLSCELPQLANSLIYYCLECRQDDSMGARIQRERLAVLRDCVPSDVIHLPAIQSEGADVLLEKDMSGLSAFADGIKNSATSSQLLFQFPQDRTALGMVPQDNQRFPIPNAVRRFLTDGVHYLHPDGVAMRRPCPVSRTAHLDSDCANLPRLLGKLLRSSPGSHEAQWPAAGTSLERWVEHLQAAVPDLQNVGWGRFPWSSEEYVIARFASGLEAPSWLLSEGTLRMLALTLPAYEPPDRPRLYLVEEPENGVHPKALEIILQSLSSIPDGQTLVTTHSPLVVQQCGLDALLCFTTGEDGVRITRGTDHPLLKRWEGRPDLGVIFASGVLE